MKATNRNRAWQDEKRIDINNNNNNKIDIELHTSQPTKVIYIYIIWIDDSKRNTILLDTPTTLRNLIWVNGSLKANRNTRWFLIISYKFFFVRLSHDADYHNTVFFLRIATIWVDIIVIFTFTNANVKMLIIWRIFIVIVSSVIVSLNKYRKKP